MSAYSHDKALGVIFHQDLPIKARKRASKGFWKGKFVEFCKRTDLHGFKYIVMEGLSSVERSCWAVAVVLSIIFAAYFVVTAYKWYARNPIITVIESTQGAIWDIPFPAVTICDLNTVSRKGARAFAYNMSLPANVTADAVFEAVQYAPLLHSPYASTVLQKQKLHVLQQVLDLNKVSMEAMFRALSPAASCTQMLQRCMWKNTIYHCDELFQQVMTMYKLCCTFNYFAVPQALNRGSELVKHAEPRRVASCGYQTALTVLLRTDPQDYYSTLVPSQGALVFIDSAYHVPNQDSPTRMVNPSSEVLISLSPERTYTTSGIRSFSPKQRQCFFSDEVQLGEFLQYSLHNCIAFQRMQVIKRVCSCVPFYYQNQDHLRICNFHDLECLENVIRPREVDELLYAGEGTPNLCLPECEHYDYPIEVAKGKLATNMKLTGLPFFNNVDLRNCSLVNVFFNDLVSTRFRRDVYFNWQNFTAAFGGLLSLMLGFTIISFVDLLIFFTIRLAYNKNTTQPINEKEKKSHETFPGVESNKKTFLRDTNKTERINNWMEKSMQMPRLYEGNKMKFGTTLRYPRNTDTIPSKY